MKRITIIFFVTILMISASVCHAKTDNQSDTIAEPGIVFFNGSLKDALKLSKETDKPVMIDVTTSWCSYCKKMKRNTFTDKTAADYFNKNFINIEIDAEKGEGISLARKYQVSSYPTIIFIDKNEKLLLFSEGYLKPDGLIESGIMALKNLKP